jgi:cell division protein FtsN
MLVGLSIGLAVALVVYLQGGRLETPSTAARIAPSATPLPRPAPAPAARRDDETRGEETQAAAPAASPFEFYESLAEFEVVIPATQLDERARLDPRAAADSAAPQEYLVQAGSFRTLADADRRQASLALLGIESSIHRVNLGDAVYHRVMIGPLGERAEFNRVMRRLGEAGIESLPLALTD